MRGSCYLVPPLATHVSPYVSVELVGTPPLGASEHSCYLVTPLSKYKGGGLQNDSSITEIPPGVNMIFFFEIVREFELGGTTFGFFRLFDLGPRFCCKTPKFL